MLSNVESYISGPPGNRGPPMGPNMGGPNMGPNMGGPMMGPRGPPMMGGPMMGGPMGYGPGKSTQITQTCDK